MTILELPESFYHQLFHNQSPAAPFWLRGWHKIEETSLLRHPVLPKLLRANMLKIYMLREELRVRRNRWMNV